MSILIITPRKIVVVIFLLIAFTTGSPRAHATTNLVINPSLETAGANGLPQNWARGRWGTNTTIFTYPVTGDASAKAARVEITQHTNGDAKWYFNSLPIEASHAYQFSDTFRSNTQSYVTIQFLKNDGTYSYLDLGILQSSSTWQSFNGYFTTPSNVKAVTVFHLIKSVGWLEIDNFVLTPTTYDPTKFTKGIISLNFDDGWLSQYQHAMPVLDNANLKGTFYIATNYMNNNYPAYMNTQQVLDLQAHGYEIGAHTRSHPDLTTLTTDQAAQEIAGSRNDLLAIGAKPINFFAYPFGAYNSQTVQIVKNAGFEGARTSDGGYNLKTQNVFTLRRQPVEVTTTLDQLKSYVDTAIQQKTWLILLFHEVNNSGDRYSITPQNFQAIATYIKQKNASVVTMEQGLQLMRQP